MLVKSERIEPKKHPAEITVWIEKFGVYVMIFVLLCLGTLISSKFLTLENLANVVHAVALLGIVAVGVTFVTYSGHFADMSVPGIIALSGMIAVDMLRYGLVVSLAAGFVTGLMIGLINAFVVGKLRANPIIWTLAVAFVINGVVRWLYRGEQIYPDLKAGEKLATAFVNLARINIGGSIPITIVVFLVMVIIGQILLAKTKFGVQLKLIGSSYEVARMTGVNVTWMVGLAFILSAMAASIGGILLTSLVKIGAYYNGAGYDFRAVTAIVLGGVSLAGGKGNMIGVLGGVVVIGLLNNILTLLGVDTFSQTIVQGMVFILVVWVNTYSLRKLGKADG
ncbi:ABC transporter, permease [Moorella glycerini]|uniref:Ribose transport system permease protein RbsC n=1 Tax=Neomoorella stamsii TaxID=1266720 RepID=A0A9X7P4K4_9FIRM|nr:MULTISPECIES: ABC transporter permease [Moorella]PRR68637.1 Ribose transport system permease protein RbsC [Moorella stamsii]CEP69024.1 ABC transporter, permease [Moorella glycerini]